MDKKRIAIIGLSFIVLIGVVFAGWYLWHSVKSESEDTEVVGSSETISPNGTSETNTPTSKATQPVVERSTIELNEAIIKQVPNLVVNGQSTFDVTNVKRVDEVWYAVSIRNNVDTTIGNAWVVFKDQGSSGLLLVAGPGTAFPQSTPIPDSVRKVIR